MCYAEFVYQVTGRTALFHVASSANPVFKRANFEMLHGNNGILKAIGKRKKSRSWGNTAHLFYIPLHMYQKCDGSCKHGGPEREYCGARTEVNPD